MFTDAAHDDANSPKPRNARESEQDAAAGGFGRHGRQCAAAECDGASGAVGMPAPARSTRAVVVSWTLVAVWAVFVFCMSANTGDGLSHGSGLVSAVYQWLKDLQASVLGEGVDVVNPAAHFCEYAVFGALFANAWTSHVQRDRARILGSAVLLAVLCASFYGVTDEFHQSFVPGRSTDPADWLVDTCGAALGAVLFRAVLARFPKGRG